MNIPENKPLTIPELQGVLQYSGDPRGRALLRDLRARERSKGVSMVGGTNSRPKVTLSAIREHAPDLMPSDRDEARNEALELLRMLRERIEEETDAAASRAFEQRAEPRLREFGDSMAQMGQQIRRLEAVVGVGNGGG